MLHTQLVQDEIVYDDLVVVEEDIDQVETDLGSLNIKLDDLGDDVDAKKLHDDIYVFSGTLPKTGMSGIHKVFAGLAALMGITGTALLKKSKKEDDEE